MANERSAPRRVNTGGKNSSKPSSKSGPRSYGKAPERDSERDERPRRPSAGPKGGFRTPTRPAKKSYGRDNRGGEGAVRDDERPERFGSRLAKSSTPRVKGRPAARNYEKEFSQAPGAKGAGKGSYGKPAYSKAGGGKPEGQEGVERPKRVNPFPDRHGRPQDRPKRVRRGPSQPRSANRPQGPTDRMRLNKYLAECGIASRRKADEIIGEGLITINGKKVFELGVKVNPKEDRIHYKGKPLLPQTQFIYYAFNKPRSVVTSTVDPQGRPTVLDFFPKSRFRLFPVGRLDWDSEGLIFITNDGEFSQKVIHPDEGVNKTYHVKLDGIPNDIHLDKLKKGVPIIGGKVAAIAIRKLAKSTDKKGWVEIVIAEGKNHQVRQMFAKLGFDVIKLRRVAIGEFKLGNLEAGKFRELTFEDLNKVFKKHKPKHLKDADDESDSQDKARSEGPRLSKPAPKSEMMTDQDIDESDDIDDDDDSLGFTSDDSAGFDED